MKVDESVSDCEVEREAEDDSETDGLNDLVRERVDDLVRPVYVSDKLSEKLCDKERVGDSVRLGVPPVLVSVSEGETERDLVGNVLVGVGGGVWLGVLVIDPSEGD